MTTAEDTQTRRAACHCRRDALALALSRVLDELGFRDLAIRDAAHPRFGPRVNPMRLHVSELNARALPSGRGVHSPSYKPFRVHRDVVLELLAYGALGICPRKDAAIP